MNEKKLEMEFHNSLNRMKETNSNVPLTPRIIDVVYSVKNGRRKANSILQNNQNIIKLFKEFAERYKDRKGGYTRIVKIGNRFGDNATMAIIELVDRDIEAKKVDLKKKTQEIPKAKSESKPKDQDKKTKTKK